MACNSESSVPTLPELELSELELALEPPSLVCLLLVPLPATVARIACSTLGHMGTFLRRPALAASLSFLHFKDNKIKSGRGLQHWKRKWKKCTLSLFTVFTTIFVLVAGTQQGRKTMVFLQLGGTKFHLMSWEKEKKRKGLWGTICDDTAKIAKHRW